MATIHRALCILTLMTSGCGSDERTVQERSHGDVRTILDAGGPTDGGRDLCAPEGARPIDAIDRYVCENGVSNAAGWPSNIESAQALIDAVVSDPCSGLERFADATDFTSDRVALITIEGGVAAWWSEDARTFRIGVDGTIGGLAPPRNLNVVRVPRSPKPVTIQNCIQVCERCP